MLNSPASRLALAGWLALASCSSDPAPESSGPSEPTPDPPLSIAVLNEPASIEGEPYTMTLRAEGGTGKGYEWTLVAGSLPPGVAGLPSSGAVAELTGAPGSPGEFPFTVELGDSALRTTRRAFAVSVAPRPVTTTAMWSPTSTLDAPTARAGHSAVWTGDEMLIWGGSGSGEFLGTGAAYDPRLDTWRPLPAAGAPEPRTDHSVVWTGTEMIVWGGSVFAAATDTGAAYDPVTDAWRPLTSAGAPEPRSLHTAVWTGTRMIVWGGEGRFVGPGPNTVALVFADGAAYDPSADSWSSIGEPDSFVARGHTAVWTGAEMLVWGGRNQLSIAIQTLGTGRSYAPAGSVWSSISDTNAPLPRLDHTAIWTDFPRAEMIVWGGFTDQGTTPNDLKSGGRYPLVGSGWQATSTHGAPAARGGHTAVWTGEEMLVWGGFSAFLTDPAGPGGAAYDPDNDAWRDLPASGEPAPRRDHTAVWTGTEMIVWGGWAEPFTHTVDTGGVLSF